MKEYEGLNNKILIAHPGKQYVHQLVLAIQKNGWLHLFITSIWYKKNAFIYRTLVNIPFIGSRIEQKILLKKYFKPLNENQIEQHPIREAYRQIRALFSLHYKSEKYVYNVEKAFDKTIEQRLKKLNPTICIGFEKSSLNTFKQAKQQGCITILDLAQVHCHFLQELQTHYPPFGKLFEDKKLFADISKRKQEEYKYTDYFFALSEFAKNTLVTNGVSPDKIFVNHLGFDPFIFKPKSNYPVTGTFKILFAGTVTARKGVPLLVQAFKELALKDATLTIVGPILDSEDILHDNSSILTYVPYLHHEELAKEYAKADIFVFPSYLDSWAMVVLEAMACGTPVIITENTGAKDAVGEGSGFIIPVDDLSVLKEKILYCYLNRPQLQEMGFKARLFAEKYTWVNYQHEITTSLQEIWRRRSSG